MENLNKDIKVFFIDLDGTALDIKVDGKHAISEKNLKQIKETMKTKEVIISTGRIGSNATRFIEQTGVKYAVLGNGSQIVNNKGKVLFEQKLSVKQGTQIIDIAKKHKLALKIDAELIAYGATGWFTKMLCKKFGFDVNPTYNLNMKDAKLKIVLWGKRKGKIQKVIKELSSSIKDLSIVTSGNGWTIEVSHAKASKGIANEYVATKLLKIKDKKHTAHVGDSMNDSTAVGHVGRLIVMENAKKELKILSPYRGPSYKCAGLAKILIGEYKKQN